jgi:hypothetical protein
MSPLPLTDFFSSVHRFVADAVEYAILGKQIEHLLPFAIVPCLNPVSAIQLA